MKSKYIHYILLIIGALITISCGTTNTPKVITISLKTSFDPKEVEWFNKSGNNTILGEAFLKTRGGEVKTCAGNEVFLIPVSKYATERLKYLYGNTEKGFIPILKSLKESVEFKPSSDEYFKFLKKTICDADGKFKFKNLPDGEYYIITNVVWEAPQRGIGGYILMPQGGFLMQKIKLKGGKTEEVIMTYP